VTGLTSGTIVIDHAPGAIFGAYPARRREPSIGTARAALAGRQVRWIRTGCSLGSIPFSVPDQAGDGQGRRRAANRRAQ
jgi:hypothetical protein